ncbi:MAG: glycosyltransferase [Vicinamibacteria bacterium]
MQESLSSEWTPIAVPRRPLLNVSIVLAFAASLMYFSWWFQDGRLAHPWLLLGLGVAATYFTLQAYGAWFVYYRMVLPYPSPAPKGLLVDVFVPVFDEPDEVVEAALRAVAAIRYPHQTYLLDDSEDGRHRLQAQRFGAIHVRRPDRVDAKAGNVNAALKKSKGDFVTIFDVDHVPDPDYLESILGCFDAPRVGFVQSAIGFRNQNENWVTRAMAEQSADAYGPASAGMHGCYAAPVWGSHCTFRRTALESIGGHCAGLAEDLHTSLVLHASGWRSAFLPVLAARGLVPRDLVSACKQHLKWARGVFEVLLTVYPRLARRLSRTQNVAYLLRCSYYLIGPVFLAHGLLSAAVLTEGSEVARSWFSDYLLVALPFAAAIVWVRRLALSYWLGPKSKPGTNWRGYLFSFLLWPVYTFALVLTILRVPIGHIATPKASIDRSHPLLVVPQVLLVVLLLGSVILRFRQGLHSEDFLPLVFALTLAAVQGIAVFLGAFGRSETESSR